MPSSPRSLSPEIVLSTSQTNNVSPFLFTYHRQSRPSSTTQVENNESADSSPNMPLSLDSVPTPITNSPIASHVGNESTRNTYPLYNFVSYHRLSPTYNVFVSSLSTFSIPKTIREALSHPSC